jgi:hypothetical protein
MNKQLFSYHSIPGKNGREKRCTVCVKLVQENFDNPDESIFIVAESICGEKDAFKKSTGREIAQGRAKVSHKYSDIFKLSDALELETYEDGPIVDGKIQPQSSVTSPMSFQALEYGMVNRLRSLLSVKPK